MRIFVAIMIAQIFHQLCRCITNIGALKLVDNEDKEHILLIGDIL